MGTCKNPKMITAEVTPITEKIKTSSIYQNMDDANKKALLILGTKGLDEAAKHMMNPTGDKPLSYAEMRARFG
jgi:hypothetical protein